MRIITFGFLFILGFVISELHAQGAYFDNRYPPSPGRRSNNLSQRSRSRPQYGYRRGVRFQSAPREDDGQVQQLTDSPNSVNGINGGSNTVGGGVNGNGVRPDQQLREGDLDTTTVSTGLGDGSSSFSPSSSLSPGVSSNSDEPSGGSYAGDGSPISTPTSTGLVDDAEPNDVTPNVQSGIGEQGPIDNEGNSQGPSSGSFGSNNLRPGLNNGVNQQNIPGSTSSGYPTGTTPSGYSGSNGNGGVKRPVNGNGSRAPGVGTNGNGVGYSNGVNNGMNGGSSVTYSNGGSPGATSGNRMGRGPLNGNGISMNGNGGSRVNGQGLTNGNRNGNNYPGTNGVASGTGFPTTTTNGYSGNGVSNGADSGLPGMTNVVDSTGSGINGDSGVAPKPTSGGEGSGVSGYSGGPSDGSNSGGHGDDGSYSHDSGHHRSGNPIDWLRDAIRGEPGRDYPILYSVPNTPFKCNDVGYPGYYADVDAQCQVFHICQMDGRKDSFLCPNGTVFSQRNFVCVWWYDFDCNEAPALYNLNEKLYKDAEGVPITGSGASSGTGPVMNPAGRSLDDGQTVGSGADNGIAGPSSSPAPNSGSGLNTDFGQRTPGTSVSGGSIDKPSQSGGADDSSNVNGEADIDSAEPGMSPMDGVGPMTGSDGGQIAGPSAGPMTDDGIISDMGQDDAGRSEGSMGNPDDSARLPGSSDEGVTDSSIQNKEDGVEENVDVDGQPETATDNVGPYSADGGAVDQSGMGGLPGSTKGPLSPSTPTSVSSSGIDNTMGSDGESGVTSDSGSGEGGATAAGAAAGAGVGPGPIDETAPATGTNVAGYGSVKGVSPSAASRYRLANRRSSPARISRTRGSRTSTRASTRSRSRPASRSSSRQRAASQRGSNSQRSARRVNRVARVSRGRANNRSQLRNRSYARRRTTRYRAQN
ncbi:mucin-19 isoform X1 [Tetranychus urticae]|uniref:mucin-19 isoform X1 n=1 Tax=Tetranychus urticae TaxID=32264 RepID=UPI00077BD629|nr:mucin-19 isoform X1 [Tetranychus urticae]